MTYYGIKSQYASYLYKLDCLWPKDAVIHFDLWLPLRSEIIEIYRSNIFSWLPFKPHLFVSSSRLFHICSHSELVPSTSLFNAETQTAAIHDLTLLWCTFYDINFSAETFLRHLSSTSHHLNILKIWLFLWSCEKNPSGMFRF